MMDAFRRFMTAGEPFAAPVLLLLLLCALYLARCSVSAAEAPPQIAISEER